MLSAILEQSLLMLPLVLGIYMSYQILQTTDLTVDGSFVLGAGLYARLLTLGADPISAAGLSLIGGFVAGILVALIQRHNRVNPLVASIIMLFMLYSINFQVMGKPNINLMLYDILEALPEHLQDPIKLMGLSAISVVVVLGISLLLRSRIGLVFRAFGAQKSLLKRFHKEPEHYRLVGLGLSNMLASLSGVMTAQVNGYADINMGFGVALTGIGAVVIGQQLLIHLRHSLTFSISLDLLGCFIGICLYFLLRHIQG
jgi:putative ABC transport system permease protein